MNTTQEVILLSKKHDITAFTSTDPTRYVIQGVHYNEKAQCLEACNGHLLIRVPVEKSEDFLPISGTFEPATDAIIPIEPFKKALAGIPKTNIPVVNNVAMSAVNGERVRLTTNDMDNENSIVAKRIDGNYPNVDQVIPTDAPKFSIALAPDLLVKIGQYFAKHGTEANPSITFQFTDELSAVRFSGMLASGKKASGVVMPMRLS